MWRNRFRGKRVDNGEWIYGDLVHLTDGGYAIIKKFEITNPFGYGRKWFRLEFDEVDIKTVGCDTGEKDFTGMPIYEGDIVRTIDERCRGIVKYGRYENAVNGNEYASGFYIEWGDDFKFKRKDFFYWIEENEIEVIGNIFDGKEKKDDIAEIDRSHFGKLAKLATCNRDVEYTDGFGNFFHFDGDYLVCEDYETDHTPFKAKERTEIRIRATDDMITRIINENQVTKDTVFI